MITSYFIPDEQTHPNDLFINQDDADIHAYLDQTADTLDAMVTSASGAIGESRLITMLGVMPDE